MKGEYAELLKVLEDKELAILRLKREHNEIQEVELIQRIKQKEVEQVKKQYLSSQHKLEGKKAILQTKHFLVFLKFWEQRHH